MYSIKTLCVTGNPQYKPRDNTGCIMPPIYQSATFAHPALGRSTGFDYSRTQNPTREYVENLVASLDGAKYGFAFATGMAAISTLFAIIPSGATVIAGDDLYGGTIRLFNTVEKRNGLKIRYTDTSDLENIKNEFRAAKSSGEKVYALFIETPSNPTMAITDIRACADIAHENGAFLFTDNTFLTPYFQQPLPLGSDIIIQSGTKFLSGHNDTLAGFITTSDEKFAETLAFTTKTLGACLSPFDAFLIVRGIKTLALRMESSQANALKIADFLKSQKNVTKILYPGLSGSAGYELNKKQASGSGAMMSLYVDSDERAAKVLEKVSLIHFAESLGGTDTLITYPLTQTHSDVPEAERERKGINGKLLRLSIGIEDADDLIADLEQALN